MTIRETMIKAFSIALIWQDGNLDDYDVCDISHDTNILIIETIDQFLGKLNEKEYPDLLSADNFGHWLCLELMGHGSGFYDSLNSVVAGISDKLEGWNIPRPDHTYADDNKIHCDFFTYGKK